MKEYIYIYIQREREREREREYSSCCMDKIWIKQKGEKQVIQKERENVGING